MQPDTSPDTFKNFKQYVEMEKMIMKNKQTK